MKGLAKGLLYPYQYSLPLLPLFWTTKRQNAPTILLVIAMKTTPQNPAIYYEQLLTDNSLVEVRHKTHRWRSFWFDDKARLVSFLRDHDGVGDFYTSLNRPKPRIARNGAVEQKPICNDDVMRITRLPFDFDPERATGTTSTDGQLEAARVARDRLVSALGAREWPIPLLAMSGNGHHAQYRIAMPNSRETAEMLEVIYRGLRGDVETAAVKFDITVRNPGRIFRAYGSVNRKGAGPYRRTTVWIPPRWRQVTRKQVEQLANRYAKTTKSVTIESRKVTAPMVIGKGDYTTLSVASWFAAHDAYIGQLDAGKHAVRCPWASQHTTKTGRKARTPVCTLTTRLSSPASRRWQGDPSRWISS